VGDDDRRVNAKTQPPKQVYAKPQLIEYGSVAKLTQSGGSTSNEAQTPRRMKGMCL
jgi:hypothetical protein